MATQSQRRTLNRRTFLRGIGASIALPMLDAMASSAPKVAASVSPVRMAFVYIPNGVIVEDWTPATDGKDFVLPHILEPLAPHRHKLLVLSGLSQRNAQALGDGGGDHARAAAVFLTGVHPNKTDGSDIRNGISVDQIAAQHIGHHTRYASLELTCEPGKLAGNCDTGYSCAYSNSISWRTETTPNPPEGNPRAVFDRLFGGGSENLDPETREKRKKYRGSILDFVLEDTQSLQKSLGPTDRRKLDEYLYAIRTIEHRIESNEKLAAGEVELDVPESAPKDYAEYARLMFDLQVLAFRTDQTRVSTFMMAHEGSNRAYREVGVTGGHHGISHHQGDTAKISDIRKINRYHMEQFAYFIEKLSATEDGDGTLLDHSMILYGSGIGDGNVHNHNNLPILLAGNAGGIVKSGRHIKYADDTPLNNLYLNMLEHAGVPTEKLGDSTGQLNYLGEV
ncbi:MAG: DUF1552 domain-containing protein [Candidatus Hydrogenedentes bacterium]|nr:DUF1552 domain-containing protein [Candidatus Hydrogenedentota bacterium]